MTILHEYCFDLMDLVDHGCDTPMEEVLKNIIIACAMLLLISACSPSDPDMIDVSISNDNVVSGQRIFVLVDAITDNPPMTYQWSTTGGELNVVDSAQYSAYWIAPESAGSYSITCTVTDSEDKHISHTFDVRVRSRTLESDLFGTGFEVLTISKETEYKTGGIWASIKDNKLRYISATANTESIWGMNFYTMLNRTDPATFLYTIWGVVTPGNIIIELTESSQNTLVCETCLPYDTINVLAMDGFVTGQIWVGTSSGLNYYDPSATTEAWKNYFYGQVNDLSEGPDYVYAATNSGIHRLDYTKSGPIYPGDTCAVLAASNSSESETTTDIWSVVQGYIQKNGEQLSVQPPEVICNLDQDIFGNIWCGKYWWDGTSWNAVPGLESVTIVRTVASLEGLTYLLSNSGALYRW